MHKGTARYLPRQQLRRTLAALAALIALAAVLLAGLSLPVVGVTGLAARAGMSALTEIPSEFKPTQPSQQSVIYSRDGKAIARFYAENRIVVKLKDMSPWVQKGTMAIEDHRFYQHRGVDLEGIARAIANNLAGRDTQGASTLTQQLVKNTLIDKGLRAGDMNEVRKAREQSISRKLREAKDALAIEKKLSKDQILEGYLNIAPYGTSVYGVESASRYYFSKSAKDLTLSEGALLSGITQSPAKYDPTVHPDYSQNRRDQVLKAMLREQMISYDQYKEAKAVPVPELLKVSPGQQGCAAAGKASFFCAYAVNEIYNNPAFGKSLNDRRRLLLRGGLKIYTTMDSNMQNAATDTAFNRIPEADGSGLSIAITSIEPGTGKIRAIAQNTPYGNPAKEHPRATQSSFGVDKAHGGGAGFQPGSSYKPVTLATWFDNGYSAYSVVGGRTHYSTREWKVSGNCPVHASSWDLKNATGGNNYATSVLEGTQKSLNTTYAGMATNLDLCDIYKMGENLGAVSGDPNLKQDFYPPFIIGAGSVTPLNMANAFGTIASGGTLCSPVALEKVVDADGKSFKVPSGNCKRTVEESVANKTAQVLVSTANSYGGRVSIGRQVMAKTGTTNGPKAAWTVGATPNLATAVWVGYSQGGSRNLTGLRINGAYYGIVWGNTVPAMAFREYMSAAVQPLPATSFPAANIGEGKTISQGRVRPKRTQPSEEPSPSQSPTATTTQITQTFYYEED